MSNSLFEAAVVTVLITLGFYLFTAAVSVHSSANPLPDCCSASSCGCHLEGDCSCCSACSCLSSCHRYFSAEGEAE